MYNYCLLSIFALKFSFSQRTSNNTHLHHIVNSINYKSKQHANYLNHPAFQVGLIVLKSSFTVVSYDVVNRACLMVQQTVLSELGTVETRDSAVYLFCSAARLHTVRFCALINVGWRRLPKRVNSAR